MSRIVEQRLMSEPWPHQVASAQAHARGVRWLAKIWHRKGGKDLSEFLYGVLPRSFREPGIYFHCFPEQQQGRKAFWDGRALDGTRYIDMIPPGMLAAKPNETEMQLELKTAHKGKTSLYQIVGSDRLGWIGSNPRGVVMSEYQRQDPLAWQLLTPILMANQGWASFCYTPWGHNHGYTLWQNVKNHPAWFAELLTVKDTRKPDGSRIVTDEDIEFERTVLQKKEAYIQSEYFCDFEGDTDGSVYGDQLRLARQQGRVCVFPIEPGIPIIPAFDIGHGDATACGWWQQVGPWHRLVAYEEKTQTTVEYWAERIKARRFELGYLYEHIDGKVLCIGPHDLRQVHWGNMHSAEAAARSLGLHFRVMKKLTHEEYTQAGRRLFPSVWIHEKDAARFVEICQSYRFEKDEVHNCFSKLPLHDWTSHGADHYKYYACAQTLTRQFETVSKPSALAQFDPISEAEYEFNPFAIGA